MAKIQKGGPQTGAGPGRGAGGHSPWRSSARRTWTASGALGRRPRGARTRESGRPWWRRGNTRTAGGCSGACNRGRPLQPLALQQSRSHGVCANTKPNQTKPALHGTPVPRTGPAHRTPNPRPQLENLKLQSHSKKNTHIHRSVHMHLKGFSLSKTTISFLQAVFLFRGKRTQLNISFLQIKRDTALPQRLDTGGRGTEPKIGLLLEQPLGAWLGTPRGREHSLSARSACLNPSQWLPRRHCIVQANFQQPMCLTKH